MAWFRLDHSHLKQEGQHFWRLYYLNTASAYLHLRSIFNTGPQEGSNEVGGIEESILLFSHNALEVLRGMGLFSVSPIIIIGAEPSLMSHLFWICLITWLRSGKNYEGGEPVPWSSVTWVITYYCISCCMVFCQVFLHFSRFIISIIVIWFSHKSCNSSAPVGQSPTSQLFPRRFPTL